MHFSELQLAVSYLVAKVANLISDENLETTDKDRKQKLVSEEKTREYSLL